MKPLALALLLLATTWSFGAAADDLVETARAAKAKRKKSTSKVITNEDVKKSKGKLVQIPALPPLEEEGPQPTLAEKHTADRKAQAEHNAKLSAASESVAKLEKELAALEQKYYEENDLDRRDGELVKQFNDVAARLQAARKELSALTPQVASGTHP